MPDFLISIVVPVYNVEEYIEECIESIQRQTYENLQIILVDDGSTDKSGQICDAYKKCDNRIEVIHQLNHGPTYSRRKGIEQARGEYIGFVDGDDYINENMYESLMERICMDDANFVHSGFYQGSKRIVPFLDNTIDFFSSKTNFLLEAVLGANGYVAPSVWSKLFKADFIKHCYEKVPDEIIYGEDLINLCICVLEADRFSLLADAFYHYRIRENSLSHEYSLDLLKREIALYQSLCELFVEYKIYDKLEDALDEFLKRHIFFGLFNMCKDKFQIAMYRFPCLEKIRNKSIVLYGAGNVGRDYYAQICRYQSCKIVAWIDSFSKNPPDDDIIIESVSKLDEFVYDVLLIALNSEVEAKNVMDNLCKRGIDLRKMLWCKPILQI